MCFLFSSEIVLILKAVAGRWMNKIHHRHSLTRTHTAHVVTRALNAEDVCRVVCRLRQPIINEQIRVYGRGPEKLHEAGAHREISPVSRWASPSLTVCVISSCGIGILWEVKRTEGETARPEQPRADIGLLPQVTKLFFAPIQTFISTINSTCFTVCTALILRAAFVGKLITPTDGHQASVNAYDESNGNVLGAKS